MLGELLRTEAAPRSPELCTKLVRKHAAWWGFAMYVVFWLFLAGTVGAVLLATLLSSMFSFWEGTRHSDSLWITCWALMGPFTVWRLVRWIRWRHREVRELARDGILAAAQIVDVTTTEALELLLMRGRRASGVFVFAQVGTERYRALLSGRPAWAQVGGTVSLVGTPESRFAFMIAPDGTDFLAKRR